MSTYLSDQILDDLTAPPRGRPPRSRLRVQAGGTSWPVLRMTARGFAMERGAPLLPGRVDLYDGDRHLMQGLAVRGDEVDGEVAYEFKWSSVPRATPPRDFALERPDDSEPGAGHPIALIPM